MAHFGLSVSDTGPGIPAEERDRIFEEFHQLDTSTTRTKGGTGLGLTISKKIIEMHGGRIWVESEVGHGSTFRFTLPVRLRKPEECLVRQRILIVEDTEDNLRIARDLLNSAGYDLLEATDGAAGVSMAALHHPDLILMDIQLAETGWARGDASDQGQSRNFGMSQSSPSHPMP